MRIGRILARRGIPGIAAMFLSVSLLPAQPALAQGFTMAQVPGYPFPDELTAARRGERIAWVFNLRGARNVWVADGPQFAGRQVTHYTGDDGMPMTGLRLSPGLIFTHGGPFRQMMLGFHPMDAYNYMYAANEYLASRGFVVLSVNYRLSTGYGRAFREPAHWGPFGASEYQDVVAGARYLQALPFVDPQRIGLWGGSYGGFLTAMGLARNSDIFKAGVDYAGVHDWTEDMTGASPAMKKIAYRASPVASIDTWKSPVLLMQSDDDRDVAFAQTVDLVPLLRAHDIPYQLIVFPDETHDSLMWRTWVRNFDATADFFERTLMRGEPIRTTPPEYPPGDTTLPPTGH